MTDDEAIEILQSLLDDPEADLTAEESDAIQLAISRLSASTGLADDGLGEPE